MKSNKNTSKYIINTIISILLLGTAIGMLFTYSNIEERSKKYGYNPYEQSDFLEDLYKNSYVLYHKMLEEKLGKKIVPSDLLFNKNLVYKEYENYAEDDSDYNSNYDQYRDIKNRINNEFISWKRNFNNSLSNLSYYAIEKEKKLNISNNGKDISGLIDENISLEKRAENNKYNIIYNFYVVLDFDEKGNLTVKNPYGVDGKDITSRFIDFKSNLNHNLELESIKNMTFVYAVPKNLSYSDSISYYVDRGNRYGIVNASGPFIMLTLGFITLCGLLIPYKNSKELLGFDKFYKIPFEIIALVVFFTIALISTSPQNIITSTLSGEFANGLAELGIGGTLAKNIVGLINIGYWFICFGIIFMAVVLLKHIFSVGIKKYMKENTLMFIIVKWIKNIFSRTYEYFQNIDLRDKPTKFIVKALGINFVVVLILCSMWFFGIFGAIIYTVVLFIIVRRYVEDTSKKYNKLLKATSKIAEGNLDVDIEENLGVFEPFKEEIQSIQSGFKKAVHEEVKSQRMKTELISNVSHDLKTPLTSIITYVDLLKDENITEENRKQYLDTLDRKSQRLQELIENLFEVSKATSGNISLDIVDVDVVSLMKQTLLELTDKISEASLIVKSNFPEGKVILALDSQRMFRVFENLIINITKYAMTGSRVYIDIIEEVDRVNIVFKNMSAVEIDINMEDLTDRFVRGDKSRNTEGSGLGLAIAKGFVELQGGIFSVNVDGDLFKVTISFDKK